MASIQEDIAEHLSAAYQTVVDELKSWYEHAKEIWPFLLLLLIALITLIYFAKPAPPTTVYMATGEGSYRILGEKYREYFKRKGIDLQLFPTSGSKENLNRLLDKNDPIQVAFVQGGMISENQKKGLLTLGSIDYEPVWFFYRNDTFSDNRLVDKKKLENARIGLGPDTEAFNVLQLNGLPRLSPNYLVSSNLEGEQKLYRGDLEALLVVDGYDSAIVQRLIHHPNIHLVSFKRADAYVHLLPYFEKLSIPMGGFNIETNSPDHEINLISTTTNLLIDENLHPAIQLLLLEAATEINGARTYFSKAGDFPAHLNSELPLSKEARYFFDKGPPTLMRYLPFWLAEFLERMFLLLLPFAAFAYPIIRAIPNYRLNLARKQIGGMYKELDAFEHQTLSQFDPQKRQEYLEKLNEIEVRALMSKASKIATADCYTLRNNIQFIRDAIEKEMIYQSLSAERKSDLSD